MKRILNILWIALILCNASWAQAPGELNYQTVVRDANGDLITNQSIDVKISIFDQSTGGNLLFTETHTKSTNSYGVLSIKIGSVETTSFASIDWSVNDKYLKVEIDAGNDFVDMGTVQLLSVPYALYANDVANKDDADADFTNEIQDLNLDGTDLSISGGNTIDVSSLQDGVNDADADPLNEIQDISLVGTDLTITSGSTVDLSVVQDGVDDADNNSSNELQTLSIDGDTLEISNGNQVVFPYDSSYWVTNGDKLYYNTGNVGIGSSNPVSKLEVKATATSGALFQVINANNDTVFAVYPDGVKVFVDSEAKGKVGGFAVSGRTPSKAGEIDILRVTPDSTRIYVNDTVTTKGKVGGFAVSGRSPSKGLNTDILFVTADSTRIFVNDDPMAKGKVGGFAVSGRSPSKGITSSYLQVTPDSTRIFVKDSVAGFGVANIEGGTAENFLNLNKQNYLIGHQTGSNTTGAYNSMIGYRAGYTNSSGSNNIFFGYKAGYLNQTGGNSVFIGTESGYVNQFTFQNTYVGYRSGYNLSGASNTMLGSMTGEEGAGGNNTFIGSSAGRKATGGNNTFVGESAGYSISTNTGVRNTYIGQKVGAFTTTGEHNVMLGFSSGYLNYEGSRNTFLGYDAGHNIHEGSGNVFIGNEAGVYADGINNRLIIDNENIDSTDVLFYGEFDQNHLRINGNVGINYQAYNSYGLIVDIPDGQTSIYTILIYGDAWASGGSWLSSDVRYKKNITTYGNALNTIMQFRGVSYDWRVDEFPQQRFSDNRQLGFIAQEVEKIEPDLVKEGPDGYKGLEYAKFTPIIVEAIKEQQEYIEALETKNRQLEERLKKLEEVIFK